MMNTLKKFIQVKLTKMLLDWDKLTVKLKIYLVHLRKKFWIHLKPNF